jgi:hypothetical protein
MGMAMGPFPVQDLSGIDIAMSSQHVFAGLERAGVRKPRVMELRYARGRLGQKTGAGWYRYADKRSAMSDPEVDELIEQAARFGARFRRKRSSSARSTRLLMKPHESCKRAMPCALRISILSMSTAKASRHIEEGQCTMQMNWAAHNMQTSTRVQLETRSAGRAPCRIGWFVFCLGP